MTDPNVNPNGQVPWQQADANPTEPLNAMTAETGTAANNAPTQAIAAGEQPTQAFTPVEQPTQAFTPAEQPTQPFAPANQPVPPTQALPPVTPAAAPAPAPAAPNSPYPGAAPAGGSVPPVYGSVSAPVYPGGGAVPPQTPYNPYMQGGQPNGQPGWSGSYGSVPPEANQKYNGLAIAGFICSFLVSLPGLILSIVGLNQIKKQGGKGKGLAIAGIIIASRTSSAKWDFGTSYLMIAILTVVMAGVKPEGGYGKAICLFFSALTLQVMSSAFNLIGISSFFRDLAWGALLLLSLASGRFDLRAFWPAKQRN